ncbi:TPA: hypothetical protein DEO28_04490 [Candidatus Dependentiae bacterium]|nr:MAG: hypothetical protein UR14_C0002G0016 [candidate division TM6 bacterium GW2011_GWE2_31_21]KKP53813.1 MAG: hypothetical protein UR43_C0002G0016 [candidate division TM6 bacterium GW2011_GWF2_33_332]HBS47593.1 hypothetical protein [Candidatus Dependentiae bacterium]HBZ73742.1 hypothetical protein [Candidatus Dependentiae bacterium]
MKKNITILVLGLGLISIVSGTPKYEVSAVASEIDFFDETTVSVKPWYDYLIKKVPSNFLYELLIKANNSEYLIDRCFSYYVEQLKVLNMIDQAGNLTERAQAFVKLYVKENETNDESKVKKAYIIRLEFSY